MQKSSITLGSSQLPKKFSVFVTFFLLVWASSAEAFNKEYRDILELILYGVLAISILVSYFQGDVKQRKANHRTGLAIIVALLFSIGLLCQNLPFSKTMLLLFTMYILVLVSLMADDYLNLPSLIHLASVAVFAASVFVIVLTLFNDFSLIEKGHGLFPYGFNGGIIYKNYFGGNMLCVIMGLWISGHRNGFNHIDWVILLCSALGLLLSGSQGAIFLLGFFIVVVKVSEYFQRNSSSAKQLKILFIPIFLLCLVVAFLLIALNSETYLYRFRGLINYFVAFGSDPEIMMLGNAQMAYAEGASYVVNVKRATGFDGSLEFAYLDILIKNGIVGLIGFVVVYFRYYSSIRRATSDLRPFAVAIFLTLLLSGMVETYIQSVHAVFGIYCYLVLSGLCGCMSKGSIKQQIR